MATTATFSRTLAAPGAALSPGSSLPVNPLGQQVVNVVVVFSNSSSGDPAKTITGFGYNSTTRNLYNTSQQSFIGQTIPAGNASTTTLPFQEVYGYGGPTSPQILDGNSLPVATYNTTGTSSATGVIDFWIQLSDGTILASGSGLTITSNGTEVVEVSVLVSNSTAANAQGA